MSAPEAFIGVHLDRPRLRPEVARALTDDEASLPFTSRIHRVVVEAEGREFCEPEGGARVAITTQ